MPTNTNRDAFLINFRSGVRQCARECILSSRLHRLERIGKDEQKTTHAAIDISKINFTLVYVRKHGYVEVFEAIFNHYRNMRQ